MTTAPQNATAQDREVRLAGLVRELSNRWPHLLGAAKPCDLPITPEELGVVLATWDPIDFSDAMLACDVDALRVRAALPVTSEACLGVGARVIARITERAREQLVREVRVHREFCERLRFEARAEREPRRETDESYFGVAGVFGSRA